ncbi:hypothetical protein N0V90_007560 [Kalmusia sp. IMI 367209]|nr:hypothetical protein N0V90_007560 [Kalmusia sp. IMI 367209]
MRHDFPRAHVTNLGGGTIGPIYITRTAKGEVLFAEAKLFGAPFKHMIIDSPKLLNIFKSPDKPIDLDVLDHPWPALRLVEREHLNFDVARLEQVEYVRSGNSLGNKAGSMVKGHPYVSVVEVTPPAQAAKKPRLVAPAEKPARRHSERRTSKTLRNPHPMIKRASPSPGGYTIATTLSESEAVDVTNQMVVLKEEIFNSLSTEDASKYEWVLTTGLKRQGKEGPKFRDKVAEVVRTLLRAQGSRAEELQALHNQYAELHRRLEKRWPYHLPHIDRLDENAEQR